MYSVSQFEMFVFAKSLKEIDIMLNFSSQPSYTTLLDKYPFIPMRDFFPACK